MVQGPSWLGVWDYVTSMGLVLIASGIGLYHAFVAKKSNDIGGSLVTNPNVLPLVLSTAPTVTTSVIFFGFPAEIYVNGISFMVMITGILLVLPIGMYLYVPLVHNLGVSSIFESFASIGIFRLCASLLCNIQLVCNNTLSKKWINRNLLLPHVFVQQFLFTSCGIIAPALALNQGPLNPEEVEHKLIFPLTRKVCRLLPKKWQTFLGYMYTLHTYSNGQTVLKEMDSYPEADGQQEKPFMKENSI